MRKRYWRDVLWFAAGTFLGGWVLGLLSGVFGGALGGFKKGR